MEATEAREVRGTHPYSFRSGEWAEIVAVVEARGRDCWLVKFPDGVTDLLCIEDTAAGWELR